MKYFQIKYRSDKNLDFYLYKQQCYKKILEHYNIPVIDIEIGFHAFGYSKTHLGHTIQILKLYFEQDNSDSIFIFNELDLGNLKVIYENKNCEDIMKNFFTKTKYIIFCCEVFKNEHLDTIGNEHHNKNFIQIFFKNAHLIVLCDSKNIDLVRNINNNILYFPPLAYSPICNIVEMKQNQELEVDLFFYGNIAPIIPYRSHMLSLLSEESHKRNWRFIYGSYFAEEQNNILRKTKIIIHIPSYQGLRTMPWAKVASLMAYNLFFIIERNEEMFNLGLQDFCCYYENFADLVNKINYYLTHDSERIQKSQFLHNYIKNTFHMDEMFKKNFQI